MSPPPKKPEKSLLDTIGELDALLLKSHGKRMFKEVRSKPTHVLPNYATAPAWQSEYDDTFRKPDEQSGKRK